MIFATNMSFDIALNPLHKHRDPDTADQQRLRKRGVQFDPQAAVEMP